MKRKKPVDWFERIIKIAQVVGYFFGPTILGVCLFTGYFSHVTNVEAGGIKFQLGQQTGLAAAQKHFAQPVNKLTDFRLELEEVVAFNDKERAAQAFRKLDGILHDFGVAQNELEARTKDIREKIVMQNQLQQFNAQLKMHEVKIAALELGGGSKPPILLSETKVPKPEKDEEAADDSSERPSVDSGHKLLGNYGDQDESQVAVYRPYVPDPDDLNPYGGLPEIKKPNIFKRFASWLRLKTSSVPSPPPPVGYTIDEAYNPYPGFADPYAFEKD